MYVHIHNWTMLEMHIYMFLDKNWAALKPTVYLYILYKTHCR